MFTYLKETNSKKMIKLLKETNDLVGFNRNGLKVEFFSDMSKMKFNSEIYSRNYRFKIKERKDGGFEIVVAYHMVSPTQFIIDYCNISMLWDYKRGSKPPKLINREKQTIKTIKVPNQEFSSKLAKELILNFLKEYSEVDIEKTEVTEEIKLIKQELKSVMERAISNRDQIKYTNGLMSEYLELEKIIKNINEVCNE